MTRLILHVPHSSLYIPSYVRDSFFLTDDELEEEKLKMVDRYTDELFESDLKVVFPVCRLVVDPERFVDDSKEMMAKKGLGAIYTKTEDGRPLRRTQSTDEKQELINEFYIPHQERISRLVGDTLTEYERCTVIDCHSFPSSPLHFEDERLDRPDICIGTDEIHTPKGLAERVVSLFEDSGFNVALNTPYAGSFVPTRYYGNSKVNSVMVEVNRRLYMNENTGDKNSHFASFQTKIQEIISQISE